MALANEMHLHNANQIPKMPMGNFAAYGTLFLYTRGDEDSEKVGWDNTTWGIRVNPHSCSTINGTCIWGLESSAIFECGMLESEMWMNYRVFKKVSQQFPALRKTDLVRQRQLMSNPKTTHWTYLHISGFSTAVLEENYKDGQIVVAFCQNGPYVLTDNQKF